MTLPGYPVEVTGQPATVTRFVSMTGGSQLAVDFVYDTFQVLALDAPSFGEEA